MPYGVVQILVVRDSQVDYSGVFLGFLLYGKDVSWAGVACSLLRKAGSMGLDRHLLLMDTESVDLSGLTPFIVQC